MSLTRSQIKASVLALITDPLNKQNTAKRVRDAFGVLVDNLINAADDNVTPIPHNLTASSSPSPSDDVSSNWVPFSHWIVNNADTYICVSNAANNAIWVKVNSQSSNDTGFYTIPVSSNTATFNNTVGGNKGLVVLGQNVNTFNHTNTSPTDSGYIIIRQNSTGGFTFVEPANIIGNWLISSAPDSDTLVWWGNIQGQLTYMTLGQGGAGGATNLGFTASPTGVTITSDTGSNAEVPAATTNNAGWFLPGEKEKLINIEPNATADQTGAEIKAAYEQELKAFTDALFDKLDTIEVNAKDDQTGAEIKALLFAENDTENLTTNLLQKLTDLSPIPSPEDWPGNDTIILNQDRNYNQFNVDGVQINVLLDRSVPNAPKNLLGFTAKFNITNGGSVVFSADFADISDGASSAKSITTNGLHKVFGLFDQADNKVLINIDDDGGGTPTTTKGDLEVNNGNELVRLPVGANGQVLKSSSSTPSGLEWANESGGGGGAPTNLDYVPSPTQGTVTSDTGTNAAIPAATVTNAGLLLPAEKDKLTNIEEFAAADQTADEVPTSPITGVAGNRVQSMMESLKALIDLRLELSGGTMTGPLILNGDPSNPLGAATKQMIDALQLEIDSLDRAIVVQPGLWDASAGTFPANAQLGFKYIVGVAGTIAAREFEVGDTITAIVNNASTTLYASNWLQQSGRNTDNQTGSEVPMTPITGLTGSDAQAIAESLKTYIDDKTSSPIIPNMVNLSYSAVIAHDVSNGLDARVTGVSPVDCQYHFVNLVAGQKGFIKFFVPGVIQVDFRRNGIGAGIQVSKKSSNTTTTGTGTKTTFAYAFDGSEILIVQENWP